MRVLKYRCFECSGPADHEHHVVPRSRGGTKTVWLCGACHALVHDNEGLAVSTSALTRAGLARARAKGVRLGRPSVVEAAPLGVARARALRASGLSLREVAERLNLEGVRTARGGKWWTKTVVAALE